MDLTLFGWRKVLEPIAVAVILLAAAVFAVWANDVREDRQHIVTVNSPTPVFTGSGEDGDCYSPRHQAAIEQPGTILRVRRIRYWKDCATVDVRLPDGPAGHIVLGIGNISVQPPLE